MCVHLFAMYILLGVQMCVMYGHSVYIISTVYM